MNPQLEPPTNLAWVSSGDRDVVAWDTPPDTPQTARAWYSIKTPDSSWSVPALDPNNSMRRWPQDNFSVRLYFFDPVTSFTSRWSDELVIADTGEVYDNAPITGLEAQWDEPTQKWIVQWDQVNALSPDQTYAYQAFVDGAPQGTASLTTSPTGTLDGDAYEPAQAPQLRVWVRDTASMMDAPASTLDLPAKPVNPYKGVYRSLRSRDLPAHTLHITQATHTADTARAAINAAAPGSRILLERSVKGIVTPDNDVWIFSRENAVDHHNSMRAKIGAINLFNKTGVFISGVEIDDRLGQNVYNGAMYFAGSQFWLQDVIVRNCRKGGLRGETSQVVMLNVVVQGCGEDVPASGDGIMIQKSKSAELGYIVSEGHYNNGISTFQTPDPDAYDTGRTKVSVSNFYVMGNTPGPVDWRVGINIFQGTLSDGYITQSVQYALAPIGASDTHTSLINVHAQRLNIVEEAPARSASYHQGSDNRLTDSVLTLPPSNDTNLASSNTQFDAAPSDFVAEGSYPSGPLSYKILKDARVGMTKQGAGFKP